MRATQESLVDIIQASGIEDPRLLDAFREVPRSGFVPAEAVSLAYEDRPLPIPHDQVTTQPSLTARMIDSLDLTPTDRVLEVGTGYGFQTALLARLAGHVVSVERWPDLAEQAELRLTRHEITNVDIRVADGSMGVAAAAPFDAILVSAAFPEIPEALADQLKEEGKLVQPIGPGGNEMVTLFEKRHGKLRRVRIVVPAHFVRLIGEEAFPDESR